MPFGDRIGLSVSAIAYFRKSSKNQFDEGEFAKPVFVDCWLER